MTASKVAKIVPRCTELCPPYEVRFRRENALLHPLEKDFDVCLVKEYTRPAAGCDHGNPELLRTPAALLKSVDYLLEVYEREDLPFGLRFSFVEDRLRAVRQDSTITRITGDLALTIFEKQISFVVRSEYRARLDRSKAFEAKLHATASEECFQRWSRLLSDSDEIGLDRLSISPSSSNLRTEVAAVHCLKRAQQPESIVMAIEYRSIMGRDLFKVVLDLLLSYREDNSHRFFRVLSSLPASSLLRPACCSLLPALRLAAMTTMAKAFKAPNIRLPISMISGWLGYTEDTTRRFLSLAGVTIEEDAILPGKMDVERVHKTDRNDPLLIRVDL